MKTCLHTLTQAAKKHCDNLGYFSLLYSMWAIYSISYKAPVGQVLYEFQSSESKTYSSQMSRQVKVFCSERVQKIYNDDKALPRSGKCFIYSRPCLTAMSKIFTYNNIWLLGNCPCLSWTSRNCLLRINLKPQQNVSPLRKYKLLTILTSFWKIWLESWNTPFWVILAENFQERQNIWKGSPAFVDAVFHMEIHVPFL